MYRDGILRIKPWCFPFFLLWVLLPACSSVSHFPREQYYQYSIPKSYRYEGETFIVSVENPLECPLRIQFHSTGALEEQLLQTGTILLKPKSDTVLRYTVTSTDVKGVSFKTKLGDPNQKIVKNKLALPFPKGRSYKITQGYNGTFSHQSDYARFALDFDLKLRDTICAADSGYVVGLIKDYTFGGQSQEWRNTDKSNFITLYHPHSGIYTQYVHLVQEGALVQMGDWVAQGQAIGLAGATGFASGPHLHFNVLVPSTLGTLVSIPIDFCEGYLGTSLTKGTLVKK
jgi:murein DD-endopeptidase MepM/ murein hydrolase activator NlpD